MVEVAGIWELGWSAPITEADQWHMVMRSFDVERLNMTPVSGIDSAWIYEYDSMELLLEDRKHSVTSVFVCEDADTELQDFSHPSDALYIFGKASYSPFNDFAKNKLSVKINSHQTGMLWPHQALAVVLYDRIYRS